MFFALVNVCQMIFETLFKFNFCLDLLYILNRVVPYKNKRAAFCNAALIVIMDYLLILHFAHTNVALVTLLSHFLACVEQLLSLRRVHLHY